MSSVNGLKLVAATSPFAVILPGVTAAAIAEVVDFHYRQHRSFVLVTFVSVVEGGVKFVV